MQVQNVMNPDRSYMGLFPAQSSRSPVSLPVHELDNYRVGPNRVAVTADVCNRIVCGFTSQSEAGPELLYACSKAGYVGARPGCADPWCRPYARGGCRQIPTEPPRRYRRPPTVNLNPFRFPKPPRVVNPQALVSPMPSITPARRPEVPLTTGSDGCGFSQWVDSHRQEAIGLLVAGYLMLVRK